MFQMLLLLFIPRFLLINKSYINSAIDFDYDFAIVKKIIIFTICLPVLSSAFLFLFIGGP